MSDALNITESVGLCVQEAAQRSRLSVEDYLLKLIDLDKRMLTVDPIDDEDDEGDAPWWRGVYSMPLGGKPICEIPVVIRTSELPRWQPKIVIEERWFEDDE